MPIYYATTTLSQLPELLVKTGRDSFMPTDLIAESLDPSLCKMLPFIYSVSGRDIMSSFFFIGKKNWPIKSLQGTFDTLSNFGENSSEITDGFIEQARHLLIAVCTNKHDDFTSSD